MPAANIVGSWAQNTLYPLRVPGSLYYFLAQCDKNQLGGRGRYLDSWFEPSQLSGFDTFRLDTGR